MVPRLLALDVDGTLLDSAGELRARTAAALATARQRGVTIAVATGRPWLVAERTVDEIGGADYAVCSNGAMVVELTSGEVVRTVFLAAGQPRTIVERVRVELPAAGFGLEFERGAKSEAGWAERLPAGVPLGRPVDDVLELLDQDRGPVRKVVAFHDDYDHAPLRLIERISGLLDAGLAVGTSGFPFVDIGPADEHKAAGLADLVQLLGISASEVVAIGDDHNDVEMLDWAGVGVAMGNAVAPAKAVADHVTVTNDEDGVAVYLEELFDGRR